MANDSYTVRLHETIAAQAPIESVSIPMPGTSAGCVIKFQAGATAPQQAAAQTALTNFDWSAGAQTTWETQNKAATVGATNAVRLTADQVNSTTSLANCTGLSFQIPANFSGAFRFDGAYTTAAATTGLQIAVNGPAQSFLAVNMIVYESAIVTRALSAGAYDTPVLGVNSGGSTALPFMVFGNLTTTAAGLLILRFRSEVAASAVTIKRGSYGMLTAVL